MKATALLVGRMGRSFGVVGYGRVHLLSDNPNRFYGDVGQSFLLRTPSRGGKQGLRNRRLLLEDAMDKSGSLLVKWKGFDSPESLREIVGWEIFWEGEDDWVPDDPEIERLDDLVGFVVRDCDDEQAVGFISGYYDRPGQDLLAIETATGQEVLCPFVLELVPKVDRGNREVFVRWSIVGTSG
ncbi:MAG: hypothetical protein M1509_06155 [Nitrospirae bacterium]|uniref:Ribosome maturation factor RimM n=1 Tax=Leptospirillum ferrodiazotrophum TaxID=412449 RepID=C6HV26_9BACT|nr:MAG: probable 16S rRNA processing protein RimM [Leptospirillum ferrodiazotrophum]MCL5954074.1 hypothetical protein [Nitrospirota bacterium]